MSNKNCIYCGGNPEFAELAKKLGHRPDIAFLEVRKISKNVERLNEILNQCVNGLEVIANGRDWLGAEIDRARYARQLQQDIIVKWGDE